ncbi:hypothetical protein [Rhizobium sp. Root1220]|uniref:hypothetical protein n=1 Tax=Rhizobium sp. Root1220 TaxID=1736432 RepID=UPI0012E35871|nr:hypothetical protein [Rhizobium sp. Root1220]
MVVALLGFFLALVIGCFVLCIVGVCIDSGKSSREEEGVTPTGGSSLDHQFHFQHPSAQGSNLSVRVHSQSQSVQSVQSSGGG